MACLTLALCCSGIHAAEGPLAIAVGAYREAPTSARRSVIARYIEAHPKEAPLANLGLGISLYEQRDWAGAIGLLKPLPAQLPAIADYASYYLAAAHLEAADYGSVARDLAPARRESLASPLAARSYILEARALKASDPAAALRLLRERYADLPQPETDLALADCYQASGDLIHAAEYYQRVYYNFLTGDAASRAGAALESLKGSMGAEYPKPSAALQLRHADKLLDARDYLKAKSEYEALPSDVARVGVGAADFLRGAADLAWPYLRDLSLPEGEADAERIYYLAECARRRGDDGDLQSALRSLAGKYPNSPWRLRALTSAANRYLLSNRPEDYVPLNRAVYENFPASPSAALAHWKVTFQAYLHNQPDAASLLREHLRSYTTHSTAGASLYFLGRYFEQGRDFAGARACFERLASAWENHYYGMLARERMHAPEVASAAPSAEVAQFLAAIKFPGAPPIPTSASQLTAARIERSRLLRAAGLTDLADSELRFGARRDGQPALLAMELAGGADAVHNSMRMMKSMNPDYLNLPVANAPRKFWELLFPLPYKSDLLSNAQDRNLDPYLLAGLIRQESEFNPQAVSRAKAYGLTQIRPVTGKQFARRAGVPVFSTRLLSQPAANLKIGSSILKSMLDQQGGSLEQTLAAYNAGPARVTEWLTWSSYREPAEFVESIPFTETRDYVQAVLRNAEMYRRLYAR